MTNDEAIYVLKNTAWLGWDKQKETITEAVKMAVEALKAQLSKEDATSGCISRQAALELGDNLRDDLPDDEQIAAAVMAHNEGIIEYQTKLSLLPSVQPERTCVNCGRTVNNGGWYADGGTRCPIEEHYALPKDGFCHLWEKRNITDDDYPERRTDEGD